jgi:outer membrane protein assembly factor BamB
MDKTVRALSQKDGTERWLFRTKGRMEYTGAIIIGNKVYIGSQDSMLYVLLLEDGAKSDSIELSGKPLASPAAVDGLLVIATDDGAVYCFGSPQ